MENSSPTGNNNNTEKIVENSNARALADSYNGMFQRLDATKFGDEKRTEYKPIDSAFGSSGFMSLKPNKELHYHGRLSQAIVDTVKQPVEETDAYKGYKRINMCTSLATTNVKAITAKRAVKQQYHTMQKKDYSIIAKELSDNPVTEKIIAKDKKNNVSFKITSRKDAAILARQLSDYGIKTGLGDLSKMSGKQLNKLSKMHRSDAETQAINAIIQIKKMNKSNKFARSQVGSVKRSVINLNNFVMQDCDVYRAANIAVRSVRYTKDALKASYKIIKTGRKGVSKVVDGYLERVQYRAITNLDIDKYKKTKARIEKRKAKQGRPSRLERFVNKVNQKKVELKKKAKIATKKKLKKTKAGKLATSFMQSKFGKGVSKAARGTKKAFGTVTYPVKALIGGVGTIFGFLNKIKRALVGVIALTLVLMVVITSVADAFLGSMVDMSEVTEDNTLNDVSLSLMQKETSWYDTIENLKDRNNLPAMRGFYNPSTKSYYSINTATSEEQHFYNGAGQEIGKSSNIKGILAVDYALSLDICDNDNFKANYTKIADELFNLTHSYSSGAVMLDGRKIGCYFDSNIRCCEDGDETYTYYCNQNTAYNLNTTNKNGSNYVCVIYGDTDSSGNGTHPGQLVPKDSCGPCRTGGSTIVADDGRTYTNCFQDKCCDNCIELKKTTSSGYVETCKPETVNTLITLYNDDDEEEIGDKITEHVTYQDVGPGEGHTLHTETVTKTKSSGILWWKVTKTYTGTYSYYTCNGHSKTSSSTATYYQCQGHCNGHNAKICKGHTKLYVNAQVIDYESSETNNVFMIADKLKCINLKNLIEEHHASDNSMTYMEIYENDLKEQVDMLYEQDWEEEYGVSISSTADVSSLNNSQIDEIMANMNLDAGAARNAVVSFALQSVGRIPYWYGGRTTAVGYNTEYYKPGGCQNGNFFKIIMALSSGGFKEDHKGRYMAGLDCGGFIAWVYRSTVPEAFPSVFQSVAIGNTGCTAYRQFKRIPYRDLQPGDILVNNEHCGIFIKWANEGAGTMYIVDCNGTSGTSYGTSSVTIWTDFCSAID